ncbi:HPF/RaiA family ribosome-associated protein [Rhodococcus sp. KRD162]|mgnify:CR=1 FL=1|uniref:HPF/RaiA family ribosome-associated protein n=1 Tax=unclassified Rhodococcus (in: high G+C Gram-positive bacteria) TaxID=192944 RepID=UPI0019CF951B|nr:HPF/RaiA family ribosome-associated protein [Rhodococcus sp. KRD162]
MDIHIRTDNNLDLTGQLRERVEGDVVSALDRFSEHLTRIDVSFRNESAGRETSDDIRCMIEARPAGQEPVTVTASTARIPTAFAEALDKLETLLTHKFGRLDDKDSRETVRGR